MKLTKAADYSLRLLTHLIARGGESTSEELAQAIDVPWNHLAKLVQTLSRRGYLITRKGKGGGIKIGKDPKEIRLVDVIEVIEGPMVISDCLLNKKSCRFSEECKVRKCLAGVRYKMLEVMSGISILDLVPTV